jgi:hypothetical protein
MIPVRVVGPNGKLVTDFALLDTGADTSGFPIHWMRRLGIRKKDCIRQTCQTACGMGVQWTYEPGLETVVIGRKIRLRAVFTDAPVALLGREDFMSEFEIWFYHLNSRLALRPY